MLIFQQTVVDLRDPEWLVNERTHDEGVSMTAINRIKTQRSKRGLALMLILGSLLLATAAFVGFYRASQNFLRKTTSYTSQVQTELDSQQLAERTRRAILREVQTKMASGGNTNLMNTLSPASLQTSVFLQSNERILEVRCLGQGSEEAFDHQVCNSSSILPKVFEFTVQSTDPSTQQMKVTRQEIHLNNPSINNYAFLVRAEDRAQQFTLFPATYSGLYGMIFTDPNAAVPPPSPGAASPRRIKFAPDQYSGNLIFQKAFITNLPSPRDQIEIPVSATNYLQMPAGVVSAASGGLDFNRVNDVYSNLKTTAVNAGALANIPPGTVISCSRVTLSKSSSRVVYQNFADPACTTAIDSPTEYPIQSNQAIYARGQNVLLNTDVTTGGLSSDNGITKVDNIAIVADGNVQLLSSIRRDSTMEPLSGFPTVMTPGQLLVSQNMTTLLSNSPTLEQITQNQGLSSTSTNPTIQVDLSYIAVGNSQGNGNVVVDPQLFGTNGVQSVGNAVSLGKAVFNGMYISDKVPTTRVVYNSVTVDGFSKIDWTHPPALSSVQTDWFSAQLGGGALQASVVRSEQSTLDLSQALSAFDAPSSGN